jgi:hypothetical protein
VKILNSQELIRDTRNCMLYIRGLNLRQAQKVFLIIFIHLSSHSLGQTREAVDIYNSFLRGINFSSSRANKKRQFHFLSTRSSTFALAVHFFHRRPHEFASAQKCIWFKCIASRDEARGAAWATLCYTLALALAVIPS